MGIEEESKDSRDAAMACLRAKMPYIAKLVSRKNYFICALIPLEKEKRKSDAELIDEAYILVDFTSSQEDHIRDSEEYSRMMYSSLVRTKEYCS